MDVCELQDYYERFLCPIAKPLAVDTKKPVQQNILSCRSDPFELLPYEIILEVCSHLPIDSVVQFQKASRAAQYPLSNETWRRRIKSDLPWLWELFEDHGPGRDVDKTMIDWKHTYETLDCRGRMEARYIFPGLVNRRRIWKICSQIAVLYASKTAIQKPPKSGNEDVSDDVSSKVICPLLARIPNFRRHFKTPTETHFTTFMLLGFGDLHHSSSVLQTYWNDDKSLTGISMTMKGRSPRLFGHKTSIGSYVKSVVIEEGDWVQTLTVALEYGGIKAIKVRTHITPLSLACFISKILKYYR